MSIICVNHKEDMAWHIFVEAGSEPMLIEINKFVVIRRHDMKHEEANTIIMQQLYHKERHRTSFVVAKDTVIFIISVNVIHSAHLTNQVMLMSPIHGGTVNFYAMYESTRMILFPACWLLIEWLAVIQRQPTLELAMVSLWKSYVQGSIHFDISKQVLDGIHQASTVLQFSLLCHGQVNCKSLATLASAPKQKSMPPTDESFNENVAQIRL